MRPLRPGSQLGERVVSLTWRLRPRDAAAFVATMQRALGQEVGGFVPVDPGAGAPTDCTHCGGRLL